MALKARRIDTKARLKQAAKKGGGDGWVTALSDGDTIEVRFLTEPEDWIEYTEHHNEEYKYFPCSDDCPGCAERPRGSKRFLAAVVDVDENEIKYFKIPKSVVGTLYRAYEKNGTIQDRDYEISRSGGGLDTEYDVMPGQPTKFSQIKYKVPTGSSTWSDHCIKLLEAQLPSNREEEEEEEAPPRSKSNGSRSKTRRKPVDTEDDEEEDEDEGDDEEVPPRRSTRTKMRSIKNRR